jgi:hypothetical protein
MPALARLLVAWLTKKFRFEGTKNAPGICPAHSLCRLYFMGE